MEHLNQQTQKRVRTNGASKKILPKNGRVMGACLSFIVESDNVHTHMQPASLTIN